MTDESKDSDALSDLRWRADKLLEELANKSSDEVVATSQNVLHELQVHQIELELQNHELRRAQKELEASRNQYFDLYHRAPIGYFTLDGVGIIRKVNMVGADMLQTADSLLISMPLSHYVADEDRAAFYGMLSRARARETKQTGRIRFVGADGTSIHSSLECTPSMGVDGKQYMLVTIADISSIVRAEAERQETRRLEAIRILAGGIARDLDGVLAATFSKMSQARSAADSGSRIDELLGEAQSVAAQAQLLSEQLHVFADEDTPVKKRVDIRRLLQRVAGEMRSESPIDWQLALPDSLWPVEGVEQQIEQALRYLLRGAASVTPDGATIRLTAEDCVIDAKHPLPPVRTGSYVKVSVTDEGICLSQEQIDHLFDPYFFEDDGSGGLGLVSAYSIVVQHGGFINVSSHKMAGTTFEIYLPVFASQNR